MRVMSYNTLFGGYDGNDDRRHRLQIEIVRSISPDILLLQEARPYLADGGRILHQMEEAIGMRGFVAEAPVTGQHTAVFIGPTIKPISFEADGSHFHHSAATLRMRIPGFDMPVSVTSVHLCPNSPHARLREISYLYNLADPNALNLIAGDFNSVSPTDPEPSGLDMLPARFRMRYTREDGTFDRSTLSELLRAGFIDVGQRHEDNPTPTVPGRAFLDTEFVPFRSDYILATQALAGLSAGYDVVLDERTDAASDHYPVWADFQNAV